MAPSTAPYLVASYNAPYRQLTICRAGNAGSRQVIPPRGVQMRPVDSFARAKALPVHCSDARGCVAPLATRLIRAVRFSWLRQFWYKGKSTPQGHRTAVQRQNITGEFNVDAELPYELRPRDFEMAMQDVYDFFFDVNQLVLGKGLHR